MTRLPLAHFLLLCRDAEPTVFGLRYVAYDGMVWVELADRGLFQKTLHALQETVACGDVAHMNLYNALERMVRPKYQIVQP